MKLQSIALLSILLSFLCDVSAAAGQNWSTLGAGFANWVNTMHVDKNGVLYAGTDVAGIFKSTDNGNTFFAVNKGITNNHIIALAADPVNPSNVYAGTRGGFFKSTNGGSSWKAIRSGIGAPDRYGFRAPISTIAIDPKSPNIVYAGVGNPRGPWDGRVKTKGTVFKSTNYGDSFTKINTSGIGSNDEIHRLIIDPTTTTILYAATSAGVYRSTNGGRNWVKKSSGLSGTVHFIMLDPKNTQRLFATIKNGTVYRSTNGGESWARFATGLPTGNINFDWLSKDPNQDIVYVAGNTYQSATSGVWKSINGGAWQKMTQWNSNMTHGWYGTGVRATTLFSDPTNSNRIYFSGTTTIYKTENEGGSWSQIYTKQSGNKYENRGIGVHGATHTFAIDPNNPARIYMDSGDHGLFRSEDGGKMWQRSTNGMRFAQHVYDILIDPITSVVYVSDSNRSDTNKGGVARSANFGSSWTQINSGLPTAAVFALGLDVSSPANTRVLYAGFQGKGVYRSTNGGASWSAFNNGLPANATVYALRSDPNQLKTIYAGIGKAGSNGGLYKSVNGGTWQKVNTSTALPQVLDVAIDPTNSKIIYVATGRVSSLQAKAGVWKNTNGGAGAWQLMLQDAEMIKSIAIDPNDSSKIYAVTFTNNYYDESTGNGPWMSVDGGNNWENIQANLPQERAEKIVAYPSQPTTLYVGSFGLFRQGDADQAPTTNNGTGAGDTTNEAPVTNDDVATVPTGGSVDIPVLTNDTDADGSIDTSSVIVVRQSSSGKVTDNGNGLLTYTHNGTATTDSFSYTVADNKGKVSNPSTVEITALSSKPEPTDGATGTPTSGGGSSDPKPVSVPTDNTPVSNLVGHWALDDGYGTTATDSSGNGNHGTVKGAVWAGDSLNGSLDFDGKDDYVDLGPLDVSGNKLTITAWINADTFNHLSYRDARIVSKSTSTSSQDHIWMLSTVKAGADTRLRFRLKTNGTTTTLVSSSSGILTPGTWIHVAAVYDGAQMRLYQDGTEVGRTARTGNIAEDSRVAAWIGRNPDGSRPFDGLIDEVRIYNRDLTKTEIDDVANSGAGN